LSLLPTVPLFTRLAFTPSLRANHPLMFRVFTHSRVPLPAVSCLFFFHDSNVKAIDRLN
jgi:hypothetical protein